MFRDECRRIVRGGEFSKRAAAKFTGARTVITQLRLYPHYRSRVGGVAGNRAEIYRWLRGL
jgi:hypothetical protein